MTDTYKFPGGTDVKIVRKEELIETINCNIVDKEIALAIVKQCEVDAANFLRKGRWTGIPFIGSIKVPDVVRMSNTPEQRELIKDAAETATNEQFVMFRRELAYNNEKRAKATRYYNYVLSMAVSKNRNLFKKLCREKGVGYARIHFFLTSSITAIENEYIPVEDESDNY